MITKPNQTELPTTVVIVTRYPSEVAQRSVRRLCRVSLLPKCCCAT